MALGDTVVWETRTDGHADNGGGYSSGGTDRSQQASPHVTFDGATITASNGGVSATITLAGYTVISGDVGNVVNITGGTNFTTGRYRITSVDTGAGTWTLDRNCTTGAGSGMTGRMGGALDHFSTLKNVGSGAQVAWVRGGTYSHSATHLFPTDTVWTGMKLYGYGTTRGDGGRPILQATAGSIRLLNCYTPHADWVVIKNFELDGNSQASTDGVYQNAYGGRTVTYDNIKAHHCRYGFNFNDNGGICLNCDAYSNTDGWYGYIGGSQHYVNCRSYDNSSVGWRGIQGRFFRCQAYGNGGDGFNGWAGLYAHFDQCISVGNGGDGWGDNDTSARLVSWHNCIAANNGGWGFSEASGQLCFAAYCATYNNTSGAFHSTVTQLTGNVTLTGDPFTNSASDDYTLNNTAGAGAACRAAGMVSSADIGTYQHADPAVNAANLFGGALVR